MNDGLFRTMEISASGLHAEWLRMQVVANNVANAETTQTAEGGPYRKQYVTFTTLMEGLQGVQVGQVLPSAAPPRMVHQPGHPDADGQGFVAMPDIKVPLEMIDMLTASRAYEANLAAMNKFRQICEEALKLLR
jgi:flagellar basal-body rod protein FlgC